MEPLSWQTVILMGVAGALGWAANRVKSGATPIVDPQNKMPVVDALRDLARQGLLLWNGSPLTILPSPVVMPAQPSQPAAPAAQTEGLLKLLSEMAAHLRDSHPPAPHSAPPAPPAA